MALQRWWEETMHELWYHAGRDEAYMRHHFRQEVEQNLREIIRGQRAQMALQVQIGRAQLEAYREQTEAIERGFSELGVQIRDLQSAISWSTEVIADAIDSLERTMSWGFAQLIWQQEQTNQLLLEILKRLSSPRTTEAEELRERGNEYFRNGLNAKRPEDRERWMNLAIDAYLEAIHKNPADFTVFQSLGVIQFFEKGNSEMALKCFREAATLAEPYSPRHAAMAWLYLGYVHRNRKELEEAYQATLEAVKLQPDWAEANYQHAIHCALTGQIDKMKELLTKAIQLDADYFPKAAADPDLLPFQGEVAEVLQTEMERVRKEAKAEEVQKILDRALRVSSYPVFALPSEERWLLQEVLDAFRQATSYVALRQAFSQYQRRALPLVTTFSVTLKGHEFDVFSVAFSPDGKFLASGSMDMTVRIWETGSWREVAILRGHKSNVGSVTFSPDGKFLASGSLDETVKIWETGSWREVATLRGHQGWVLSVSFSPDGKFLASGSGDKTVKVWEVGSWREVATLRGHEYAVTSVAFSPDGKFLASGSVDETVRIWETGSWREVATLKSSNVGSVTFSPDGKFLASGSGDKTVKVWEVGSWREVATLRGHEYAVTSVSFSPDGKFLASGSGDKTVKVWEVGSWREVATLRGHESGLWSVTFSPDGKFLASGSVDMTVKIWGWGLQGSLLLKWLEELERRAQEEERRRLLQEEEEQRRREEERRRREQELRLSRRAQGLCEECGKPLSFWDKLLGQTKCPQCR
jgi:WD40 repeat protein/tetratricopeptide (TPR) repeat protein